MAVEMRLFVQEVAGVRSQFGFDSQERIVMHAMTQGDANKNWSKYTPWAELKFTVTNETGGAFGVFKPGAKYRVLFDELPAED